MGKEARKPPLHPRPEPAHATTNTTTASSSFCSVTLLLKVALPVIVAACVGWCLFSAQSFASPSPSLPTSQPPTPVQQGSGGSTESKSSSSPTSPPPSPSPPPERKTPKAKKSSSSSSSTPPAPTPSQACHAKFDKETEKSIHAAAGMNPEKMFSDGADACAHGNYVRCYTLFLAFSRAFPTWTEGFSNAAVGLERMGKVDEALAVYRAALKCHPDNPKITLPFVNTLQSLAAHHYQNNKAAAALVLYEEICSLVPSNADAFLNKGTVQESLGLYEKARSSYVRTVELSPLSAKGHNALCRLALTEVSGAHAGRFDVDHLARQKAFAAAKVHCAKALELDPNDATANMHVAMLYKDGLEFDVAIEYLRRAAALDPSNPLVLSNLASTLSRAGDVAEAVAIQKQLAMLTNSPSAWYSIGTMSAPLERLSGDGKDGHMMGIRLAVESVPPPQSASCTKRAVRMHWQGVTHSDVNVTYLHRAEPETFGSPQPRSRLPLDQSIPVRFHDKHTVAVTLRNVYMEGAGGVLYTDCETFAVQGQNTDIPHDFSGVASETLDVPGEVIYLIHKTMNNHYHWIAEGLGKLLLARNHFGKSVPLVLPSRNIAPNVWDTLATFDIDTSTAISYEPRPGRRYRFASLHLVDFVPSSTDADDNDLWSDYLPSRLALSTVREFAAERRLVQPLAPMHRRFPVLYISRKGVREVKDEEILTTKLQELLGSNVYIFKVDNVPSESAIKGLQGQIDLFSHAQLIFGPHGAGLTNMVFAPMGATVAEFTMTPHCNRCFGYMAAALGLDYWVMPELSCFYHLKYQMTETKALAVLQSVAHMLRTKGLDHLIVQPQMLLPEGSAVKDRRAEEEKDREGLERRIQSREL